MSEISKIEMREPAPKAAEFSELGITELKAEIEKLKSAVDSLEKIAIANYAICDVSFEGKKVDEILREKEENLRMAKERRAEATRELKKNFEGREWKIY
ncbi:MAG: hypothetical protein LBU73_05045 [Helicobacteraceae bacterium]|jgi:hypothetical protein|nr:hypothetical protein [Helicobacteraceae bacterium]